MIRSTSLTSGEETLVVVYGGAVVEKGHPEGRVDLDDAFVLEDRHATVGTRFQLARGCVVLGVLEVHAASTHKIKLQ